MISNAYGSNGLNASQQRTHQVARLPAPQGGIDVRQGLGAEDVSTCIYSYNMLPYEYGMKVRQGYREWQTGITEGNSNGVTTVIPYTGVSVDLSDDRIFSVTSDGIYDTTDLGGTPVLKIAFSDTSTDAGYGVYCHYTSDAGDKLLFYADSRNGLFQYDPDADTWEAPTGITGVDVADIRCVMSHKQRLWFSEAESTAGYYLDIGAIAGAASPFYFGSKFRSGGTLAGLFNWTVDGGEGVDDYLVAVSQAGDVLPYQGSDPTSEDWAVKGSYFIGEIPNTPVFGTEQGGQLFLLSSYGVISMNDLLVGVDTNSLRADEQASGISVKVAALLRRDMADKIRDRGWGISNIPSQGGLLITTPTVSNQRPIQYYFNLATKGWGLWRDIPMLSFTNYEDNVIIGLTGNRVAVMDVNVDNVELDPSDADRNGVDIEFSILTSFNSFGTSGVFKRVSLIRPDFVGLDTPTYSCQARYDYDTEEASSFQLLLPPRAPTALWDANTSTWDAVYWAGTENTPFSTTGGSWGKGRYVAMACIGKSRTSTRLIGWDVIYDTGGVMP